MGCPRCCLGFVVPVRCRGPHAGSRPRGVTVRRKLIVLLGAAAGILAWRRKASVDAELELWAQVAAADDT